MQLFEVYMAMAKRTERKKSSSKYARGGGGGGGRLGPGTVGGG